MKRTNTRFPLSTYVPRDTGEAIERMVWQAKQWNKIAVTYRRQGVDGEMIAVAVGKSEAFLQSARILRSVFADELKAW